jgi:hypothetical protein
MSNQDQNVNEVNEPNTPAEVELSPSIAADDNLPDVQPGASTVDQHGDVLGI